MRSWKARDARAKFSEVAREALREGPQVITRRGKEEVVVVALEEWQRLERNSKPTLKDLLLGDGPRLELKIPSRKKWRFRKPFKFVD